MSAYATTHFADALLICVANLDVTCCALLCLRVIGRALGNFKGKRCGKNDDYCVYYPDEEGSTTGHVWY